MHNGNNDAADIAADNGHAPDVNEAPARGNRARLQLPSFRGDEPTAATLVRWFARRVDAYRGVCGLSDEETARAVSFALEGPAQVWLTNLPEIGVAGSDTWTTLRPLLLERFSATLAPEERRRLIEELRQEPTETVATFQDRCVALQVLLDANVPDTAKTGANEATYRARFETDVLDLFLAGLREAGGLRRAVSGATATTLAEYVAFARRQEQAARSVRTKESPIAAVEGQEQTDGEAGTEVAAFGPAGRGRGNYAKGRGRGGGGNTGYGGRGGGRGGTGAQSRPGGGNTGWGPNGERLCYFCGSPDHLKRDCPSRSRGGGNSNQPRGGDLGGYNGYGGGYAGNPGGNNGGQRGVNPNWANGLQEYLINLGAQQLAAQAGQPFFAPAEQGFR